MRKTVVLGAVASLLYLLLLASGPVVAGQAQAPLRFEATPTGPQEVPNVTTGGTGKAKVIFDEGFTLVTVDIDINVNSLMGVILAAHFHCNVANANGPVVLGLVGPLSEVNGKIQGTLTNADFVPDDPCPAVVGQPVNNVAALAFAMRNGLIYLNIHTSAVPSGEIRGQLVER